jgi:hypothetical protein
MAVLEAKRCCDEGFWIYFGPFTILVHERTSYREDAYKIVVDWFFGRRKLWR